mmetsp:Transcript_2709/g.6219  ORF Transcript_2709/g.6219 Transcript_2709/m.6219 type:complete len:231 (+) Transcript_2709:1423-2115(+)
MRRIEIGNNSTTKGLAATPKPRRRLSNNLQPPFLPVSSCKFVRIGSNDGITLFMHMPKSTLHRLMIDDEASFLTNSESQEQATATEGTRNKSTTRVKERDSFVMTLEIMLSMNIDSDVTDTSSFRSNAARSHIAGKLCRVSLELALATIDSRVYLAACDDIVGSPRSPLYSPRARRNTFSTSLFRALWSNESSDRMTTNSAMYRHVSSLRGVDSSFFSEVISARIIGVTL